MNKGLLTLIIYFLLFLLSATAQDIGEDSGKESFFINYNIAGHMSYFRPSLRLSFEDNVNDDIALNYELGYINHRLYFFNGSENITTVPFRKLNGLHVSVEPRWYRYTNSTFVSFSVGYHHINDHRVDDVWRFGSSYIQKMDFLRIEKTGTIMFHGGGRISGKGNFTLGASLGMGFRLVRLKNDLPIDADYIPSIFPNSTGNLVDGDYIRFAAQIALFLTLKGN